MIDSQIKRKNQKSTNGDRQNIQKRTNVQFNKFNCNLVNKSGNCYFSKGFKYSLECKHRWLATVPDGCSISTVWKTMMAAVIVAVLKFQRQDEQQQRL